MGMSTPDGSLPVLNAEEIKEVVERRYEKLPFHPLTPTSHRKKRLVYTLTQVFGLPTIQKTGL